MLYTKQYRSTRWKQKSLLSRANYITTNYYLTICQNIFVKKKTNKLANKIYLHPNKNVLQHTRKTALHLGHVSRTFLITIKYSQTFYLEIRF